MEEDSYSKCQTIKARLVMWMREYFFIMEHTFRCVKLEYLFTEQVCFGDSSKFFLTDFTCQMKCYSRSLSNPSTDVWAKTISKREMFYDSSFSAFIKNTWFGIFLDRHLFREIIRRMEESRGK